MNKEKASVVMGSDKYHEVNVTVLILEVLHQLLKALAF